MFAINATRDMAFFSTVMSSRNCVCMFFVLNMLMAASRLSHV
jgi:hypothetical protein